MYRNHEYFTENKIWWIASLLIPCYIFVYMGFKVKELNSKFFDIKLDRSVVSSGFFYVCFTAENILMVSLFFAWTKTTYNRLSQWVSNLIMILVIVLSLSGSLMHLWFTYVYFHKQHQVSPAYGQEITEPTQDNSRSRQSPKDLRPPGLISKFSLLEV